MMNDTVKTMLNHRSIRKYKDKQVSRETVDTIISCAQMAPTSSHLQEYTIIEVRDSKKREFLAEVAGGQKWVVEAPLVLLFCADLNRGKKYFDVSEKELFSNTESYTVAVVDTSLAMQNAFLAAESMGLGGVAVGGIRNDVEALSKEFELPDMVAPLYLLCLGYPDDNPGVKPRLPKEEIHKVDFYDDRNQDENIDKFNATVKEYYIERTHGKISDTWTQRSGKGLMAKKRYEVGDFFRKIGLLKR